MDKFKNNIKITVSPDENSDGESMILELFFLDVLFAESICTKMDSKNHTIWIEHIQTFPAAKYLSISWNDVADIVKEFVMKGGLGFQPLRVVTN